jgi:hypothetical protein
MHLYSPQNRNNVKLMLFFLFVKLVTWDTRKLYTSSNLLMKLLKAKKICIMNHAGFTYRLGRLKPRAS